MDSKDQILALNILAGDVSPVRPPICPTRERLAQAFRSLQNISMVRNHRKDPHFGRSVEECIIWRELLDLELQHIDEQIERICETGGETAA